jgi:predicted lipoprotein with Yx(FWY)xxD motif
MGNTALALAATALAAAGLSACGSSSGSGSGSPSGSSPAPAKQPAAAAVTVLTASKPSVGSVLVDGQGMTLYHRTSEKGGRIMCTGSCASIWLPEVLSGSAPSKVKGAGGALSTVKRPDGTQQLAYGGQPLYRYSGDTARTDVNGQGIEGTWFAVTASKPAATAKPAAPSGTSTNSVHYGY